MVNANGKPFWASKTLWISVLAVAIGVLEFVNGQVTAGLQLTIAGVVSAILRLVTTESVKWTK